MFNRKVFIGFWLALTFLLMGEVLLAQKLELSFENASFREYVVLNDSADVAPAFELIADYAPGSSVFQVVEQNVSRISLPANITYLREANNLSVNSALIEEVNPGIAAGRNVVSLRVNLTRIDSVNQQLLVTRYLKFRVYKNPEARVRKNTAATPVQNHPLATGTWYRIPVERDGIHQLDAEYLEALGLDLENLDPRNLQLWGTNGFEIPRPNNAPRVAFQQIPVLVEGESDGSFDAGDRLLFYGDDTNQLFWDDVNNRYLPEVHPYSERNYYFLTVGALPGFRLNESNNGLIPSRTISDFQDLIWIEEEERKADSRLKSGREWLGQRFTASENGVYKSILRDTLPGTVPTQQAPLFANLVGRSVQLMSFDLRINGTDAGSVNISPIFDYNSEEGAAANSRGLISRPIVSVQNGILNIEARINHNEENTEGFIDWVRLYLNRSLTAKNDYLFFYAPSDGAASTIGSYRLDGFDENPIVMEVSTPESPRLLAHTFSNGNVTFNFNTRPENIFVAQSRFFTPPAGSQVPNQNLRGESAYPDYIIITSERFLDVAGELAQYRAQNDGLVPVVATQNQIFNEFSSGKTDITAIRDYVKMFYDRALAVGQPTPRYLLLFGNTTYDYKGLIPNALTNDVITYQSQSSLFRTNTFATDDYFGTLDDNEGDPTESNTSDRIDLGIGRIPAETIGEARTMLEKIRAYDNGQADSDWQNLITFAADDDFPDIERNRDLHVLNAEGTLIRMEADDASIRFKRIYLFSYPEETTGAGRQVPQASQDLINTINQGTLLVNYSGHGNEQVLSDEEFYVSEFNDLFTNSDRLTIFVTATCQFGRYDDSDEQSGAERLIFNPNGGAIASFTTTRVVFTGSNISNSNNFGLNIALSQQLTGRDDEGKPLRLGDIYFRTKNTSVGGTRNTRKFILLGDPASRIRLPDEDAALTAINGDTNFESNDSLRIRALDLVQLNGEVRDGSGNKLNNFNGSLSVTVFDAPRIVRLPDRSWVLEDRCFLDDCQYETQNDLIFKGRTRVNNGEYQIQFVVPKDISFSDEEGRILLFGSSEEATAGGVYRNIVFNGINPDAQNDGEGPQLDVYLNDPSFVNGNLVGDKPTLIVELNDETGINTTGTGVGHEIIATIDTQPQQTIVLNPFYEGNLDDFTGGRIEYPLDELPEGNYTLTVRAWDVQNNPSERSIQFEVASAQELSIRNVYNYPNPMNNRTAFTFEHNQPGNPLDVSVRIFTLSGRPVQQLNQTILTNSSYASISWNGRDRDNDRLGNGTYLYVLRVATDTPEGRQVTEKIEKLVIIR
jgi:hypothetical protein